MGRRTPKTDERDQLKSVIRYLEAFFSAELDKRDARIVELEHKLAEGQS